MSRESAFHEEGVIVEVKRCALFRVELRNGHRLTGYVLRRDQDGMAGAGPGDRVMVELTCYDLSKGRVRNFEKKRV